MNNSIDYSPFTIIFTEGINKIVWRVDGKVKQIQRGSGDTKWLSFDYDAMGHRIAKHIYDNTGTTLKRSTYYILDARGNQISTYVHEVVSETAQFNLKERNIFGSSRLGSKQDSINVLSATITQNYTQVLGTKYYEFSDLPITIGISNVLIVFNDIKVGVDSNTDSVVDGYVISITNSSDYSPFGVLLYGRTVTEDKYRYGYQGSEMDYVSKGNGNSFGKEGELHLHSEYLNFTPSTDDSARQRNYINNISQNKVNLK